MHVARLGRCRTGIAVAVAERGEYMLMNIRHAQGNQGGGNKGGGNKGGGQGGGSQGGTNKGGGNR
jgi:hypothetical protein